MDVRANNDCSDDATTKPITTVRSLRFVGPLLPLASPKYLWQQTLQPHFATSETTIPARRI